jgi:hypothetical protein
MKMLYKRWKTLWKINDHLEVARTELANEVIGRKLSFCMQSAEMAYKSPYAATVKHTLV